MPQSSTYFAAAKLRMKQKKFINMGDINRLIEASDYASAKSILQDIGLSDSNDYDKALDDLINQACKNIRAYSSDEKLSWALLVPYDAHNIKIILKSRLLNIEPNHLYKNANIPISKLIRALDNRNYSILPKQLQEAVIEIEKLSLMGIEPYMIDVIIDKASYALLFNSIDKNKYSHIYSYFQKQLVFVNVLAALRLKRMNKSTEEIEKILIPSDLLSEKIIARNIGNLQALKIKLLSVDRSFAHALDLYISEQIDLSELEIKANAALADSFNSIRFKPLHVENILYYFYDLAKKLSIIRLIMVSKLNSVSTDKLKEAIQNKYGI